MTPLRRPLATLAAGSFAVWAALALGSLGAPAHASQASLQQQLSAKSAHAGQLRAGIAHDNNAIAQIQGSVARVQRRLSVIEAQVAAEQAQLAALQAKLRAERARLTQLQVRLQQADLALAKNLVSSYETDHPDAVTVILNSNGFADLLERLDFIKRAQQRDTQVITVDRALRIQVIAEATRLGKLEARQQTITNAILARRNQIDSVRLALVSRQIAFERARSVKSSQLAADRAQQSRLQHQLSVIAARQAAASGVGPVSVLHGSSGFVFPMPAGAAVTPGSWSQDQGVDISAAGNTPLLAVGSGTIVLHGIGGFGPSAPVLHLDNGRYVYYGHAGPGNTVAVGTHVSAGQVISEVGAGIVGISTGPHLEIGFADASGTPASGTSGEMLALLQSAYH